MKCPKCEVIELTMADRSGVEIDYCSACRGVWLDRGELDKIIDRTALAEPQGRAVAAPAERVERSSPPTRYRDDDDDDDDDYRRRDRKRRGSFLGELFDF